jgi:hypothetical protein
MLEAAVVVHKAVAQIFLAQAVLAVVATVVVLAEVEITAEAVLLIQVVEQVAEITFLQFQMVDQVLLSFAMPSNERST